MAEKGSKCRNMEMGELRSLVSEQLSSQGDQTIPVFMLKTCIFAMIQTFKVGVNYDSI